MSAALKIPKATTAPGIITKLVVLALLLGGLFYWLVGSWGVVLLFVVLAVTTDIYTKHARGYHALIVLNAWSGAQRTLFQGLNFTLPWENITDDVDLKVELKAVLEDTYPSKGGSLMKTKYVYTITINYSGVDAGENVILFGSFEPDAIKMSARALLSMLLSDYFGKNMADDLLDKNTINKAVFEKDLGKSLIDQFQKKHGVLLEARLEDTDFSDEVQKARDVVSKAKSIDEAINALMATRPNGDSGMSRPDAEKIVRMLNIPGIQEFIISVDAKGLEDLHDVTFLGGLGKVGKK